MDCTILEQHLTQVDRQLQEELTQQQQRTTPPQMMTKTPTQTITRTTRQGTITADLRPAKRIKRGRGKRATTTTIVEMTPPPPTPPIPTPLPIALTPLHPLSFHEIMILVIIKKILNELSIHILYRIQLLYF